MKPSSLLTLLALVASGVTRLPGAGFDSGSTGAYGPISVESSATLTLDLPPDGVLHCTTITVSTGATLKFNRNALNTPVCLLATGNVRVAGRIQLNGTTPTDNNAGGLGGPGGFDGGPSGYLGAAISRPAGDGHGPGGGNRGSTTTAGSGGFGTVATRDPGVRGHGGTYGNAALFPLLGGSGGGGADGVSRGGGGGGGGGIIIASNTSIVVTGQINADGANGGASGAGAGSGGAIRLVAPRVFGTGQLTATGSAFGGSGRIRIDSFYKIDPLDPTQTLAFSYSPAGIATVGAHMVVFPAIRPRLNIVEAAGTTIPDDTTQRVAIMLPVNAPTNQTIKVQARDFGAAVPIRVALIPDSGDSVFVDATIDNTGANPATATIDVTVPVNVLVTVEVWTR